MGDGRGAGEGGGGLERGRLGGRGQRDLWFGAAQGRGERSGGGNIGTKMGFKLSCHMSRVSGGSDRTRSVLHTRPLHVFAPRTLPHDRPNSTPSYKRRLLVRISLSSPPHSPLPPCLLLPSPHRTLSSSTAPRTFVSRSALYGPHSTTMLRSLSCPPVYVVATVSLHFLLPCLSLTLIASTLLSAWQERRLCSPSTTRAGSRSRGHRDSCRSWS